MLPLAAATDHRIAGRKAATLARLAAAGFPVPPGVVVPAAIFEHATGEREVPADVAAGLLTAVRGWGEVPLAVRSSGVDEDSADASYAGLFTTVLNVRGDVRCSTRSGSAGTRRSMPASLPTPDRSRRGWPSWCSRWWRPPPPGWRSPPTRSRANAAVW